MFVKTKTVVNIFVTIYGKPNLANLAPSVKIKKQYRFNTIPHAYLLQNLQQRMLLFAKTAGLLLVSFFL
jgi:hypothetical protein